MIPDCGRSVRVRLSIRVLTFFSVGVRVFYHRFFFFFKRHEMLLNTILAIFLAALSASLTKNDGTGTNSTKRIAKTVTTNPEKYSRDLLSLFSKYQAADNTNRARIYFQNQLKHAVQITNRYIKKGHNESEEVLQEIIEKIESEDEVLGKKLKNFYEKARELVGISEDINKYVLDVDKGDKIKVSFRPLLEQKVADLIKKFESKVFEAVIKKKKRQMKKI